MSFWTDFNATVGTVGDTFKNVWSSVNAPTSVTVPPVRPATPSQTPLTGVTTSSSVSVQTVLLGAAAIILVIVAILFVTGKGGRR